MALDLSLWDVSGFSGGDVPDITTWRTVSTFADPTVVGLSRGQAARNHFGYTLAATVEGASFTVFGTNRLSSTPTLHDDDSGKWSNACWYWNQRDVYHSFLASNHAGLVNTFNNLYSRNYNALKANTMSRYGIDGIWVPETMGWNASPAGTIYSDYTKNIYSTGAEVLCREAVLEQRDRVSV